MSVQPAKIHFNQHGTPVASEFDDVYFSNASGIDESEYVFLQNNQLPQKWQSCTQAHFSIAETGFGTGLNFLLTLALFLRFRADHPQHRLKRLYFISIEKFPIEKSTLAKALNAWPQLASIAELLLTQYPLLVEGNHRLSLADGQVMLDLCIGDVEHVLTSLPCPQDGLVNAWYLDGFAPSKNPQMWSAKLFADMARLSCEQATFATFTAAGIVKRGLAQAGFIVEKRPGFGRKRDMLAGHLQDKVEVLTSGIFARQAACLSSAQKTIGIVGAGLAAANCAYALCKRGFKVKVFYQADNPADGASGNLQGGFYPQLNATASISSQIHLAAFQFAANQYQQLFQQGHSFNHQWCGAFFPAFSAAVLERQTKLLANQTWPTDLIHGITLDNATALCGLPMPYPGLFIPKAGWINPSQLVNATIQAAAKLGSLQLLPKHKLVNANFSKCGCQLSWQSGQSDQLDAVVFTAGYESVDLPYLSSLPLRLVRGQVEQVASTGELAQLKTLVCHKGYLTPAQNGMHALGSTYVKGDTDSNYRVQEAEHNIGVLEKALSKCDWAQNVATSNRGRAAIRCSTPDHLPIMGAIPDFAVQTEQYAELYKGVKFKDWSMAANLPNAFVLTGLGSRGLTTAPLLAEALACQVSGEPLPLDEHLLAALNPNRYLVRELVRRN